MTQAQEDLLKTAEDWLAQGRKVALATVISTWGSSPRPVGSHLLIDDKNRMLGSVSGGCVEGAVVEEAKSVMRDGKAKLLRYGVADEDAWEVGLACGGTIEVYLEAVA